MSIVHNYHEQITPYNLSAWHITKPLVLRNLAVPILYEETLRYEEGSFIAKSGALAVTSNKYTGRLPKEKRVVKDEKTADVIQWGEINIPIDDRAYLINRSRALDYLNSRNRIYIVDSFAGWDPRYRIKVRTICSRAYHALFMTNMLIVPSAEELESYGDPDFTIINAGLFPANRHSVGVTSDASIIINLTRHEMAILGTEYAGEMKKSVFFLMNYLMPFKQVLPMHCAANVDSNDSPALFFGLSGTGKTTLSSDDNRFLVGDDEHCWSDDGIFNIENGCYAKCIDPPDNIKRCITFGALLENLTYDPLTREINYSDESITTNTRSAYSLQHVHNAKQLPMVPAPTHIIFLACDIFGVLPPVSRLNHKQAMYYFISGYTSKIPNTEVGIRSPMATFSACFGEVFLPLNPVIYAQLFEKKLQQSGASVWLVNTGWIGGDFRAGNRISLKTTRAIISAICDDSILNATFRNDPLFGFDLCTRCPGIAESLDPQEAWSNVEIYGKRARMLANMFHKNIKKYDTTSFIEGGPKPRQSASK